MSILQPKTTNQITSDAMTELVVSHIVLLIVKSKESIGSFPSVPVLLVVLALFIQDTACKYTLLTFIAVDLVNNSMELQLGPAGAKITIVCRLGPHFKSLVSKNLQNIYSYRKRRYFKNLVSH